MKFWPLMLMISISTRILWLCYHNLILEDTQYATIFKISVDLASQLKYTIFLLMIFADMLGKFHFLMIFFFRISLNIL